MPYIIAGLLLTLLSLYLFLQSRQPPAQRQRYTGAFARQLNRQLVSWEYGLTGRPDFITDLDGVPVPVLIKKGRAPVDSAHDGHVAQVLVYCLLIHEAIDVPPPYGIIRYSDRTFEVDYNETAAEAILDLVDEIRAQKTGDILPRSHENQRHCYACSHRKSCDESLV